MSLPLNSVFKTFFALEIETEDDGTVLLRQGDNVVKFPPELTSGVVLALLEAEKGDR